jgi:dihydroflavonol-4-reductase
VILVIGATGFLGTNLVRELAGRGESVRILRRPSSNLLGLEKLPLEEVSGDLADPAALRQAMRGCRHVFHVAGGVSLGTLDRERLRRVNVGGTEAVAAAALAEGVERLVYTSSSVSIGYGTADQPATEDSPFNLGHLRLPYVDTKKEAEEKILEQCGKGLPAVVVNPGYVFGPWDKAPKLNQLLIMAARGKLNFYFGGGLSVVDVSDVARGHVLALEKGRVGQRYILSNLNLTYREFFTRVNAFVGRPPPKFKMPYPVLLGMGYAAQGFGKLFGLKPELSAAAARLYQINHYLSSEKARQELGYTTTPLEESFRKTFDWLKEYKYIP